MKAALILMWAPAGLAQNCLPNGWCHLGTSRVGDSHYFKVIKRDGSYVIHWVKTTGDYAPGQAVMVMDCARMRQRYSDSGKWYDILPGSNG